MQVPKTSNLPSAGFYFDPMHNSITPDPSGFICFFLWSDNKSLCGSSYIVTDGYNNLTSNNMFLTYTGTGFEWDTSKPDACAVQIIPGPEPSTAYVYVDGLGFLVQGEACPAQTSAPSPPNCYTANPPQTYYNIMITKDRPKFAYVITPYVPVVNLCISSTNDANGLLAALASDAATGTWKPTNIGGDKYQLLNLNLFRYGSEQYSIDPKTKQDNSTAVALQTVPSTIPCPSGTKVSPVPPSQTLQLQTVKLSGFDPNAIQAANMPSIIPSVMPYVVNVRLPCGDYAAYYVGYDSSTETLTCTTVKPSKQAVFLVRVNPLPGTMSVPTDPASIVAADFIIGSLIVAGWPRASRNLPVVVSGPAFAGFPPSSLSLSTIPPWAWAIIGVIIAVGVFCVIYFPLRKRSQAKGISKTTTSISEK